MARRSLCFALIITLAVTLPAPVPVLAHDGYAPIPIFVFRTHPDFPFEEYAQGKLGIILPSYDDLFLFIAYRNLVGARFTPAEIRVLRSLWNPLINARMKARFPSSEKDWAQEWFKLRATMKGQQSPGLEFPFVLNQWNQRTIGGEILFFINCSHDAFHTAVHTLVAREKAFGRGSPEVRAWAEAQDQVFLNCGRSKEPQPRAFYPKPADVGDSSLIRADRSYQIAAAHFYAGEYDRAHEEFDVIAQDTLSPWHGIAPYLAARAAVRKGTLSGGEFKFDTAAFTEAEERLNALLRDQTRREWHGAARQLLGFVRIRLHARERLAELTGELSKPGGLVGKSQDLKDFFYLLRQGPPEAFRSPDDMTLWMLAFGEGHKLVSPGIDSGMRWQKTKAMPWLVAALQNASQPNAECASLIEEAAQIPESSPAYWTVRFLRARLLAEAGETKMARQNIENLLRTDGLRVPSSADNLFLSLRMRVSENLTDFLRYTARRASAIVYVDEYALDLSNDDKYRGDAYLRATYLHPLFDHDSGVILNRYFPLRLLAEASRTSAVIPELRKQIALVTFTRAVIMHNSSVASQASADLLELAPQMKNELTAYQTAPSETSREFAAVFLILRYPGMATALEAGEVRDVPLEKIEPYGDNWWCASSEHAASSWWSSDSEESWQTMTAHLKAVYQSGRIEPPPFLSKRELEEAQSELKQMTLVGSGPDWLDARAIAWAKAHPDDPRVPEALHLAVRAYRYGCTDVRFSTKPSSEHMNFSKLAFELLHRRYPNNEWTKKTPYWF
jgi:hypothetical protein